MNRKDTNKPLYVSRSVKNGEDIVAWAKEQGLPSMLEPDDLHVTICYSKEAMPWDIADAAKKLVVPAIDSKAKNKPVRKMEKFGKEENVLVLQIESDELHARWQEFCDHGASYDFPEYKPHVTISYKLGDDIDLKDVQPYQGKIVFGPERFKKIDKSWAGDAPEIDLTSELTESVVLKEPEFVVVKNPSAAQIAAQFRKCRGEDDVRGLVAGRDLYIWPAFFMTHAEAQRKLAVKGRAIHLRPRDVEIEVSEVAFTPDLADEEGWTDQDIRWFTSEYTEISALVDTLQQTPSLQRFYKGEVDIDFDDKQQWIDLGYFVNSLTVSEGLILEASVTYAGHVRVHTNPTAGQLGMMCDSSELRGVCFNGDVFVWRSYEGTHMDIMNGLGIPSSAYPSRFYAYLPGGSQSNESQNIQKKLRNGVIIAARDYSFPVMMKCGPVERWFAPRPMRESGVRFFQNPSRTELITLAESYGQLCGLSSGDDVWVWDSHERITALHARDMLEIRQRPFRQFRVDHRGGTLALSEHAPERFTEPMLEGSNDTLPKKFWLMFDVPTDKVTPDNEERILGRLADIGSGKLRGIRGISDKREIMTSWFLMCRNAALVMDPQAVANLNDIEKVHYEDPDYLCANGMIALYRIWDKERSGPGGKPGHDGVFQNIMDYFLSKLAITHAYEANIVRNSSLMSIIRERVKNGPPHINSFDELADFFIKLITTPNDAGNYYEARACETLAGVESDLRGVLRQAIMKVADVYGDEGEWIISNPTFNVPPNSILLIGIDPEVAAQYPEWKKLNDAGKFEAERLRWRCERYENLMAAIDRYGLRDRYALRFVDANKFENNRSSVITRRRK